MTTETTALELYIGQQLKRFNVTDAAISELYSQYGFLGIESMDDIIGYKKVQAARKDVKRVRCEVENRRKELVADALKHNNAVNAEAKRITQALQELEATLEEKEVAFDKEKERIRKEAEDTLKKIFQDRVSLLSKREFIFDGAYFTSDYFERVFEADALKAMDEETFNNAFVAISREYEVFCEKRDAEKRAEQERLVREAEEANAERQRLAQQREEQAAKERELAAKEAALKAEEKRIQDAAKAEADRLQKIKDDEARAEAVKLKETAAHLKKIVEDKLKEESEQTHKTTVKIKQYYRVEMCGSFKAWGSFLAESADEAFEQAQHQLNNTEFDSLMTDFEWSDREATLEKEEAA